MVVVKKTNFVGKIGSMLVSFKFAFETSMSFPNKYCLKYVISCEKPYLKIKKIRKYIFFIAWCFHCLRKL